MSIVFKKKPKDLDQEPKGTEMDEERPPRLEVTLKKQSRRGIWQNRYFVLYDDVIMYYNNEKRDKLMGVIPCQNIIYASLIKGSEKRLDILIKSGNSTHTLKIAADFEADTRLWAETIKELSRLAAVKPKFLETDRAGLTGKFWKKCDRILSLRPKFIVAQNTGQRIETLIDKHFEAVDRENVEWNKEDDEDSENEPSKIVQQLPVDTPPGTVSPITPHPGLVEELQDERKQRENEEAFKRLNVTSVSPNSTKKDKIPVTHTD